MNELPVSWVELAVAIPLAGAAIVARLRDAEYTRRWCLGFLGAAIACTVAAWAQFALGAAPAPGGRFAASLHEFLQVDTLTAPLLPLTALLYLLTAIATLRTKVPRFSFAGTLVALALTLAALACHDPWGIIGLLAATTIPPYLELRARGRSKRIYVLHMAAFVGLLVVGWAVVEWEGRQRTHTLLALVPLLLAVLIRTGSAPFHLWVTDLFENASFGRALVHFTPMLGAYAAVRLILPVAPEWVLRSIGIVSLVTAVYTSGMALVQRDIRRFFAFIFLSHTALILVGLETVTPVGLTGGLCFWMSVGLSLAGFGLTLRALEARHGRLSLLRFHGLYEHTPLLAVCFLLTGMASVGFPGTIGFMATELLVDGAVQSFPYVGIAVLLAGALNGIAILQAYFRLFTGTRHVSTVPLQVGMRERIAVLTLATLIIGGGLWPQPIVQSRYRAALKILEHPASELALREARPTSDR
jgi:NADH-quinone oxidoreductase subunit M